MASHSRNPVLPEGRREVAAAPAPAVACSPAWLSFPIHIAREG